MTIASTPPPPSPRSTLPPLAIAGIVLGALIVAAATAFVGVAALWRQPVALHFSAAAGSTVEATVADSPVRLHASADGRVHVLVTGWHAGPAPTFRVRTSGDTTRVDGGCVRLWLVGCSVVVDISLPPTTNVRVTGADGDVTAAGLDGSLRVATSNGTVSVADASGSLDLQSVNGAVVVQRSTSQDVTARTSNGAVELHFVDSPRNVTGHTINGAVTVQVPSGADYRIDAHTVNGPTDVMTSNPDAARTITVETVNGAVTVERTAG